MKSYRVTNNSNEERIVMADTFMMQYAANNCPVGAIFQIAKMAGGDEYDDFGPTTAMYPVYENIAYFANVKEIVEIAEDAQ